MIQYPATRQGIFYIFQMGGELEFIVQWTI